MTTKRGSRGGFTNVDGGPNYAPLANEGEKFTIPGGASATVRYKGVTPGLEVTKVVTGSGTCSNDFFGKDPAGGEKKVCEIDLNSLPKPEASAPIASGSFLSGMNPMAVAGIGIVVGGAIGYFIAKKFGK